MSEFVSSWHFSEREQKKEAERAGQEALTVIDRTYGDGYPHYRKRGRAELAFHNGHHARAVGDVAFKLCRLSGLGTLEQVTGRTAGYAHDIVQLKGRGTDESESAEWVEEALGRRDIVAPELRAMASLAILGTQPLFDGVKIVGQKATAMDYPSKDAETLARCVASADLGELYTPQGPFLSHQYFREINGMAQPEDLSIDKLAAFQRNQVALVEGYRYPLPRAEKELTRHKSQVVAYSAGLIEKIESGEVRSWNDVIELDRAFARRYS